jgi:hypothetical protein
LETALSEKDRLHRLIDELPESAWPEATRYLTTLLDEQDSHGAQILRTVPAASAQAQPADEDDDDLSPDDVARIAAGREAYRRGDVVSHDELRRQLRQYGV